MEAQATQHYGGVSNPVSWARPLPSIEMVTQGLVSASPALLRFPALDSFVAGSLRSCSPFWEVVLKGHPKASEIPGYITEGVRVQEFFCPVPPLSCFVLKMTFRVSLWHFPEVYF